MTDSDQKIEDLPIESIKRICSCLNDAEVVRVCLTLPGWDYVLSLSYNKDKLKDYAASFQWLDRRLCELIAEESCTPFFVDLPRAAFHYLTEESRDVTWSRANGDSRLRILVWHDLNAQMLSPTLAKIHTRRMYSLIPSEFSYIPFFDAKFKLPQNSVIIYLMFGMVPCIDQFEWLVGELGPSNVLLVLQLEVPSEKSRNSSLQRLISLSKRYQNVLRRAKCIKWRIWYVDCNEDEDRIGSKAICWALQTAYDRLDQTLTSRNE